LALSEGSRKRFAVVREHYEKWQHDHPKEFPEQYMGHIYNRAINGYAPKWKWVVEYVSCVIASAGTPPGSLNRNPRYSNRINRPSDSEIHGAFWATVLEDSDELAVATTNYDILIEKVLRHRPMLRPRLPGCFYGGLPRPQHLKGAAQPFSVHSPERLIEMTGTIPVYKLHGSLTWALSEDTVQTYQDMRAAFRHGGTAALVPPIPEKPVPPWLRPVWNEAAMALRRSNTWVVCGYSAQSYDTEVRELLRRGGNGRPIKLLLLSPESTSLVSRWREIVPNANIVPLPGLPEGIEPLGKHLI
jgi:SIR2-like domain